jgi:phosphatidylglycerophosphate synthase
MIYAESPRIYFAIAVLIAFVSDVYDGVLARKLMVATPELRHLDSRVDMVFYATAAWAVWKLHPDVVRAYAIPGLIVIGLDVLRYAFDFTKFGKDAAYHAWSSKLWGVSLAAALVLLLGFGLVRPFVPLAVGLGVFAQAEGLLISVVLPRWTHDVPSVFHAARIRNSAAQTG